MGLPTLTWAMRHPVAKLGQRANTRLTGLR
jgi:hypothetical protein